MQPACTSPRNTYLTAVERFFLEAAERIPLEKQKRIRDMTLIAFQAFSLWIAPLSSLTGLAIGILFPERVEKVISLTSTFFREPASFLAVGFGSSLILSTLTWKVIPVMVFSALHMTAFIGEQNP